MLLEERGNYIGRVITNDTREIGLNILMILIEPLLLWVFGTTPGKFIFGLYVYTVNENKLTYQEGLSRARGVFFYGMGLGTPLINIVCGIVSYVKAKKKQTLAWESGSIIVEKRRGWWSYGICTPSMVLCLFAAGLVERNGMLPINRGTDISKAELIENYEAYIRVFGVEGAPELDVTIQADIEKTGYDDEKSTNDLIPVEGEKQYYHLNFVMKRE